MSTNLNAPVDDEFRVQIAAAPGPNYRLDRELGGGGMSRVFIARDESLGRDDLQAILLTDSSGGGGECGSDGKEIRVTRRNNAAAFGRVIMEHLARITI